MKRVLENNEVDRKDIVINFPKTYTTYLLILIFLEETIQMQEQLLTPSSSTNFYV